MRIRVTTAARIAGLTGVVLALGAGAAPARPVTFWACHGPLDQPLGTSGLSPSRAADGHASAEGDCLGSGGLTASFSRPDPAGGSSAMWTATLPAQTTMRGARVRRALRAATGTASGGSQRFLVRDEQSTLDSVDLADAPTAESTTAVGGAGASLSTGVDCGRSSGERCSAATAGSASIAAIALEADDAAPPQGSVAGLRSPVRGALGLIINATDRGAGLAAAEAVLDGITVTSVPLDPACADLEPGTPTPDLPLAGCAKQVSGVALPLDLTGRAAGPHRLRVRVIDAAGNTADAYDGEIAVAGPDPVFTPTVTIAVGEPGSAPARASAAGAGTRPVATPQCVRPQLSMVLDQRTLRVAKGKPVLRAGGRYRFRGRLTCRPGSVRRNAFRGTPVELLNVIGKRTFAVTGATTMAGGRVTVILSYRSSRTLVFRHRSSNGTSRVKIPITVVRKRSR